MSTPLQPPISTSPVEAHGAPTDTEHAIGVTAFTVARRIVRRHVARDVLRVVHDQVRAGLAPTGAPSWVAERLERFSEREGLLPFVKAKGGRNKLDETAGGYLVGPGLPKDMEMDEVGQRFQEFYSEIEEQLVRRKWKGRHSFRKGLVLHHLNGSTVSSSTESASGDEKLSEKESLKDDGDDTEKESEVEDRHEDERDKRIREVLEAVERTLCTVFYDR